MLRAPVPSNGLARNPHRTTPTRRLTPPGWAISMAGVSADRGGRRILSHLDLEIGQGAVVAVVGPNGAGKSTLLGVLSGRIPISSGRLQIEAEVAEVLQPTAIDPNVRLTVAEVVRMGAYRRTGLLKRMSRCERERIQATVAAMGLDAIQHATIDEISGGQRQRTLIAQAITQDAPILLLDEPTAGLDADTQATIRREITRQARTGHTVVYATHHLADLDGADLLVAFTPACICCAPPAEALQDDEIRRLIGA